MVWHIFPGLHLPGSMHSQEHQGCIRLNWWFTIKIHIINSQLLYKLFAFDRNLHLLAPNSLWPVQSILASLDSCNQASFICNIQLTEQTSQTNLLTHWRRELNPVSPKILQIASRARYKQFSRFSEQLGLLTQLQQDTKGNIMDIFLLSFFNWDFVAECASSTLTGFYPSPKSFWSCTHANSCSKYILPLVQNTHYTSDLINNLPRGIPKLGKTNTGPFSIHKGT